MSDVQIMMVPKDLYYHEVAYVRGLEKKNAELVAALEKARDHGVESRLREKAAEDRRIHDTDALRAQNAELVEALREIEFHGGPAADFARAALKAAGEK